MSHNVHAAFARAIAAFPRPWDRREPTAAAFEFAKAMVDLLEQLRASFKPAPFWAHGLRPGLRAAINAACAAACEELSRSITTGRGVAVEVRWRSQPQRRAYLAEHRERAIALGIPADLFDQLADEIGRAAPAQAREREHSPLTDEGGRT